MGCTGFLPSFPLVSWFFLLTLTRFDWVLIGFYRVLLGWIGFD